LHPEDRLSATDENLAYATYWRRKRLMGDLPQFPVRRWWPGEGLSEIESVIFDSVRDADGLLDFGAGDLRVMKKLRAAGYVGDYETLDIGTEYPHTYRDLDEVRRSFAAILCLDVIEHIPLEGGLSLLDRLARALSPGGVLVVQTPNALCSRDPLGWDMTHVQTYNVADLWAFLTSLGLEVHGYRISFGRPPRGPLAWLKHAARVWITRQIACDYAENIVMIARRPAPAG
jgi:hypothetical protein